MARKATKSAKRYSDVLCGTIAPLYIDRICGVISGFSEEFRIR